MSRPGPLSLLLASLAPVAGAPAIHAAAPGLVAVALLAAAALPVVRHWGTTLRRLAFGAVAAVSVGVSTWIYGAHDVDVALGAAMRVEYLVLPAAVLTPFIDPRALGDHLGQRLRLPARPVVAATVALERLESLGAQWEQISRARRTRGVGPEGSVLRRARVSASMTLALLVSAMRMSGSMALAMDARGFAGAHRRTWAEPAPWTTADWLVSGVATAVAVLPWSVVHLIG